MVTLLYYSTTVDLSMKIFKEKLKMVERIFPKAALMMNRLHHLHLHQATAVEEIVRRAEEAWQRGATEVCMQGGIHPAYTGDTYLGICRAVKAALPGMHVHAFSPLEI